MIQVALWEPEIPPNTGNVARLCAATASNLHLIGRLGFRLDDRRMRRAGLDYWESVTIQHHESLESFLHNIGHRRVIPFSARAPRMYTSVSYCDDDILLFGSESRGLPRDFLDRLTVPAVTIPMLGKSVRSLNLATAVGIALYEALRQVNKW
jgi:tRNA (cytidine/uridine-2'-O-)-methyltransferase